MPMKENQTAIEQVINKPVKRRRAFVSYGLDIEPYHKKQKVTSHVMVPLDDERRNVVPSSLSSAKFKNTFWMLKYFPKKTPRRAGWNSPQTPDKHDAQENVYYLPQINLSPTSTAVVRDTLKRAQQMAAKCNMASISVTYDLAIEKIALEIQAEERPQYDNIFIVVGAFHIELSLVGVLGKYIAESGGSYLLNEKGSISSFLSGKAYKRSECLRQLLALVMEILHLNSYQFTLEEVGLLEIEELKTFILSNEIQAIDKSSIPEKFVGIFDKYESYRDKTRNGAHGKIAQFWFAYVEIVQLYHQSIRSIRMEDLDLYIHSLYNISSLFFTFNHHNYARWLVVYHNNLLN